jgi:transposase
MFVRVKTNPNSLRRSVQIVHSVRKGKKVSQQIVRHVGIAYDEKELEQLKNLAESIKFKLENTVQPPLFSPEELDRLRNLPIRDGITSKVAESSEAYRVNLKDILEEDRVISGIHDIYGRLFDEMGYEAVFPINVRQSHTSIGKIFKDIVLARIANPVSKQASVEMLADYFGIFLPLHKVYRMMDKIDDNAIERLNKISYNNTRSLFGNPLDVVFFDATTLYFESFDEDDLRRLGYSKDMKFNQPQVLLALLVTREGLPVGYRVFEGDTYEGHTLLPVLESLKEDYQINRVVFVADSGMLSRDNLNHLESNGFKYIVGARLKNMNESLKLQILDKENYRSYSEENEGLDLAEFDYCEHKRLIVSYKEKRARKDRNDRKKAILKLRKKLEKNRNQKSYLSNYGYKKYLKIEGESRIQLDEIKIEQDSRWDGLHGVITNITDFNSLEVLEYYGNLWTVEESFRITKHDLKVRPVFHWNPSRVKAHIAIVFTAYSLVRYMTYRVKRQYKKLSPDKIRKLLLKVQTTIIYDTKKKIRYGLPSKITEDAKKIYDIFKADRTLTPYIMHRKCSAPEN